MYWFVIFYYHVKTRHVVPVYPLGSNNPRDLFRVYAASPQQAVEMAGRLMTMDRRYRHHLLQIGTLSSMVDDCDKEKWYEDNQPRKAA
jgi:hypothetical protein